MTPIKRAQLITAIFATVVLTIFHLQPSHALYPQLSTDLKGPAFNGKTPQGKANVDNVRLTMQVEVKNVNLPNGTVLEVHETDLFGWVGRLTLNNGQAKQTFSIPFGIGASSTITVKYGSTTLLTGGSRWNT